MKDNFSSLADQYASYRPSYPTALIDYIISISPAHDKAWDCATGNGQIAQELAKHFDSVYATDISEQQLQLAPQESNIHYSVQAAEKVDFADNFFDLIVVAQAIHWFDFDKFYAEVRRTMKAEGVLIAVGYGLIRVSAQVNEIIDRLYAQTLNGYWDSERHYIDENYRTIPFPFAELKSPDFVNTLDWRLEQLLGYLETWSAVKHYKEKNGTNPVQSIQAELKEVWGGQKTYAVRFPVFVRAGKNQ